LLSNHIKLVCEEKLIRIWWQI